MALTERVMNDPKYLKINERIFLICNQCLWTVTCINKTYLQETFGTNNLCPICSQGRLSSFPITPDDSFTYTYSKKRALNLTLGIKNKSQDPSK
jgi:hypothetical protein